MRLMRSVLRRLHRDEEGHTMIAVVGAISLVSLLVGAALAATNGDLRLTSRDLDDKRAFAAAQAGIADYVFHLNADNTYWTKCTAVPSPHAVNQQGSTANRRNVPGDATAQYALQLIPATGQSTCNTSSPQTSMLESGTSNTGTFRIRSTGYAGEAQQSAVVTFKRASLLDFLYFTQYETSDPVTYGSSTAIAGAYIQCTKWLREGRLDDDIPGTSQSCTEISFISADDIQGPMHTNDGMAICGNPTFGRTASDMIEVSSPPQGWYNTCSGSPNFLGTYQTNSPVLTPPPTDASLETIAGAANTYTGQTTIQLSGNNTIITTNGGSPVTKAIPASGVIYVQNGTCSTGYTPFGVSYPSTSGCGTVRVRGSYSGSLTIAAENDILITDDLDRSGDGMLGLIANNFVRVYHPCDYGDDDNLSGSQTNLNIDAAMLAIQHSFIVDNYNCGDDLGTLTVEGAIAQKFRGAVGTHGGGGVSSGYAKNYLYDDRLKYREPPHFLDPVETAWHIQRQTLDFP
jgi:Tfp pilus assembly protein PilX